MIYISMSYIRDFLDCPRKLSYRSDAKYKAEAPSQEALEGNIVHLVLEKGWQSKSSAKLIFDQQLKANAGATLDVKKMQKCIDNFFLLYQPHLTTSDSVESFFKVPWGTGVTLVGKYDRIHNGVVYDWKTGARPPEDLNRDVQFIIYYLAYKKMYKKEPSAMVYASLYHKKSYLFTPVPALVAEVENELIPYVIQEAKKSEHPRLGFYKYGMCKKCPFKPSCWEE